jgi:hypothetical protein
MLLSELSFGSFLSYSPKGQDEAARSSQMWVRRLKDERYVRSETGPAVRMSEYVAARLEKRLPETPLGRILTPSATLVPVPSSALLQRAGLWVPYLLAAAFVRHGLGLEVAACLTRSRAIRKAALSAASDRPTAQDHMESMLVRPLSFPPQEIVLLDDVITRGATMLAAASRLRQVFPAATIRGFAIVRTVSNPDEFVQMFDPCTGTIRLRDDGQTTRRP